MVLAETAPSTPRSGLGVAHLERLWRRTAGRKRGLPPGPIPGDPAAADAALFDGLGLVIEETLRFLHQSAPTLEEFEEWVLERNSGFVEPHRVDRINALTEGTPYAARTRQWLEEVERSEPVLGPSDLSFFEENGYVVVRGAVARDQCHRAEQAIWDFLGKERDDPDRWHEGITSIFVLLFHHPALWANRRSPRIHKAFAQIWGTADLWPVVDRVSMNPPERGAWRFPGPRLHWDVTAVPPIGFGVQGLLYLTDTASDQGAFTCVPGFHRKVDDWLRSLPPGVDPRERDLVGLGAIPVPGAAGDLIIYHQGMPHGGSPNRAARPRVVQFLDWVPPRRPPASWPTWR